MVATLGEFLDETNFDLRASPDQGFGDFFLGIESVTPPKARRAKAGCECGRF